MPWASKRRPTAADRQRARDYNSAEHKAHRKAGQRLVDSGQAHCWRCGNYLPPGKPWHVGHDDNDRRITRGPECVPCNLTAAARKGARIANARRSGRADPTRDGMRRASRNW